MIHASVIVPHFREYWLFGVFFVVSAVFQLVWGMVVWNRRDDRTPARRRCGRQPRDRRALGRDPDGRPADRTRAGRGRAGRPPRPARDRRRDRDRARLRPRLTRRPSAARMGWADGPALGLRGRQRDPRLPRPALRLTAVRDARGRRPATIPRRATRRTEQPTPTRTPTSSTSGRRGRTRRVVFAMALRGRRLRLAAGLGADGAAAARRPRLRPPLLPALPRLLRADPAADRRGPARGLAPAAPRQPDGVRLPDRRRR